MYLIIRHDPIFLKGSDIFELIVVIDWSAAAAPGPKKPSPDRCWIAWVEGKTAGEAEYFRTRHDCIARIHDLVKTTSGNALLAFDFPFGYPAGAKLGGGRQAGKTISKHLEKSENDANNRFEVANILNRQLSPEAGPFWGHPKSREFANLTWQKPPFHHSQFNEWRLAEKTLKDRRHKIMNVWQLLGQGSVGSQTLTGLAELYDFSRRDNITNKVRFWPFETNWQQNLDGIILAEVWPSLNDTSAVDHPIKDARQVIACRDWLSDLNKSGKITDLFAAPESLTRQQQSICQTEEGWILGVD